MKEIRLKIEDGMSIKTETTSDGMLFSVYSKKEEEYVPKDGEFVYVSQGVRSYMIAQIGSRFCSSSYAGFHNRHSIISIPKDILGYVSHRPATESEKQLLIDEVWKHEKKHWTGTFWVKEGQIVALKEDPKCVFAWMKGSYLTSRYVGVCGDGRYVSEQGNECAMLNDYEITPASPEQEKRFHDILKNNGKKWNPESLKVDDIEKPESYNELKYEAAQALLDYCAGSDKSMLYFLLSILNK